MSAALFCTLFLTRLVLLATLPVLRPANRILEKQKNYDGGHDLHSSQSFEHHQRLGDITPLE
jgi:hypothetical protein